MEEERNRGDQDDDKDQVEVSASLIICIGPQKIEVFVFLRHLLMKRL